jgi:hypothetical protein
MASVASWAKPLNDQHMGLGDVLAHRCEAGNELFVDVGCLSHAYPDDQGAGSR